MNLCKLMRVFLLFLLMIIINGCESSTNPEDEQPRYGQFSLSLQSPGAPRSVAGGLEVIVKDTKFRFFLHNTGLTPITAVTVTVESQHPSFGGMTMPTPIETIPAGESKVFEVDMSHNMNTLLTDTATIDFMITGSIDSSETPLERNLTTSLKVGGLFMGLQVSDIEQLTPAGNGEVTHPSTRQVFTVYDVPLAPEQRNITITNTGNHYFDYLNYQINPGRTQRMGSGMSKPVNIPSTNNPAYFIITLRRFAGGVFLMYDGQSLPAPDQNGKIYLAFRRPLQ